MISNNIYIDDVIKSLVFFRQNKVCRELTSRVKKLDPIEDYDGFREFVIREILERVNKKNTSILYSVKYGEEGGWYGHRDSIVAYSGADNADARFLLPNIWHGSEFVGYDTYKDRFAHDCPVFITMSDYCIDQIHAVRPWLQIYPIGPYISYAKGFYDRSRIESQKKKNGRTVLYFPQHSTETTSIDFDKSDACKNIEFLLDRYDTVLVSVYWADVSNPIYNYYRDKGAELVSSGVRSDENFIRRQRSLIEMADDVYGNALGTNLGYSIALGKPYYFFEDDIKILDDRINRGYIEKLEDREREIKRNWNNCTQEDKEHIYDKFWGGKRFIRTEKEIADIISIQKKLLGMTHGDIAKIDKVIKAVVNGNERYDFTEDESKLIYDSVCKKGTV